MILSTLFAQDGSSSPFMTPSESASGTTAVVDWSSFWPDMIVAVFTGLFIGLAVLWAERWISGRTERRAIIDAQNRVVELCRRWMQEELVYKDNSLMPNPEAHNRIRRHLERAPSGPLAEDPQLLGYLERFVVYWDEMLVAAEKVEPGLRLVMSNSISPAEGGQRVARRWIHGGFERPPKPWPNFWESVEASLPAADKYLSLPITNYLKYRVGMETMRDAFNAVENAYDSASEISAFVASVRVMGPLHFKLVNALGERAAFRRARAKFIARERSDRHKASLAGYEVESTAQDRVASRLRAFFGEDHAYTPLDLNPRRRTSRRST